jgi:hypothetical protein
MENDAKKHVEEQRLEAYAMNALAEDKVAIVEEHLLFCTTCQDRLEAVERYSQAMRCAAKRIREEEVMAPESPGAMEWVRARLHFAVPIWTGALAMAGLIFMVGLQLGERPGPPVDVELQAVRGASTVTALAGHALHLLLDSRGVQDLQVWPIEIVDEDGSRVWNGTGTSRPGASMSIEATADKAFKPGTYFVRLLKDGEGPVREYQLVVQKATAGP